MEPVPIVIGIAFFILVTFGSKALAKYVFRPLYDRMEGKPKQVVPRGEHRIAELYVETRDIQMGGFVAADRFAGKMVLTQSRLIYCRPSEKQIGVDLAPGDVVQLAFGQQGIVSRSPTLALTYAIRGGSRRTAQFVVRDGTHSPADFVALVEQWKRGTTNVKGSTPTAAAVEQTEMQNQTEERVTDHAGWPIAPDADFFAEAPAQIGQVLTAHTSLKKQRKPLDFRVRWAIVSSAGTVATILAFTIARNEDVSLLPSVIVGLGVGTLAGLIAHRLSRFRHTCSYVGRNGIAEFTISGGRQGSKTPSMFLFSSADELRTRLKDRYVNGVYQNTEFDFRWTHAAGKEVFRIHSYTFSKSPKPGDRIHLARSAENAWSRYFLSHGEASPGSELRFNLDHGDWVAFGGGFLTLSFGGQVCRCPPSDIAEFSIAEGVVKLKRKDARTGWFGKEGVFTFDYATMANAKAFLTILSEHGGQPPSR